MNFVWKTFSSTAFDSDIDCDIDCDIVESCTSLGHLITAVPIVTNVANLVGHTMNGSAGFVGGVLAHFAAVGFYLVF